MDDGIIPALFLITLVIGLVIGVVQFRKARKAQREHHRSVSAEVNGEPDAGAARPATASRPADGRR